MSSKKTVGSPVQIVPHPSNHTFLSDPGFRSTEFGDQGQGDQAYGDDRSVYPGIVHAVRTDGTLDVVVFDQNGHGRMFRGLKYLEGDAENTEVRMPSVAVYCRDHETTTAPPQKTGTDMTGDLPPKDAAGNMLYKNGIGDWVYKDPATGKEVKATPLQAPLKPAVV